MPICELQPYFTNPSSVLLLRGAEERFTASGYDIVLYNIGRPEQVREQFRNVVDGRPDGVLVIAMPPPERELERLLAAKIGRASCRGRVWVRTVAAGCARR